MRTHLKEFSEKYSKFYIAKKDEPNKFAFIINGTLYYGELTLPNNYLNFSTLQECTDFTYNSTPNQLQAKPYELIIIEHEMFSGYSTYSHEVTEESTTVSTEKVKLEKFENFYHILHKDIDIHDLVMLRNNEGTGYRDPSINDVYQKFKELVI